ncbi:MAG: hypothetical protein ACK5LJ_17640 [Paracoccus sp. (in: a-proteobacteria)]
MSDAAGQAQMYQEQQLEQIINRKKHEAVLKAPRGKCLYCGEAVQEFFCDPDCRDDYEKEQRIKQQNGVK